MDRHWIRDASPPMRLILAWMAPDNIERRTRWAVGIVEPRDGSCDMRYLTGAEFLKFNDGRDKEELIACGFDGYPGLDYAQTLHTHVCSAFLRRLPPRSRPDFSAYTEQFRLDPRVEFSDLALLARTEAHLPNDGFSLVDPLEPSAPTAQLLTEVAGYRHYAASLLSPLRVNDPVLVVAEPENPYDVDAVQLVVNGRKIGNINRLQAPTFRKWLKDGVVTAHVEKLNGTPERPRVYAFVEMDREARTLANALQFGR